MAFDPDSYIASKEQAQGFNPDAYIAAKESQPVQQIAAQPAEQQSAEPQGFPGASVIEPAATMVSGAFAEIPAGLSALLPTLLANPDEAVSNINAVREYLTYQPKTEKGKQGLQAAGDFMKPVGEAIQATEEKFGESGAMDFEALGLDPATGYAVGKAFPTAAASLLGVGGGKKVAKIPAVAKAGEKVAGTVGNVADDAAKLFTKQSKFKQKIAADITAGGTDRQLAKYIVNGAGKAKADPLAKNAITQGFDEGVIAAVKGASAGDKAKLLKMTDIMKRGKSNSLYAVHNRPSDIAGNSLLDRVKHVKSVNRQAGASLEKEAIALRGQAIDSASPINKFIAGLDDMGVSIGKDFKPIFKGSDVEGLKAPEAAIKRIVTRLSSGNRGTMPDAYELHRMKKYIDEVVTYGKAGDGLAGKTERLLKQLRHDIDATLDNKFPAYDVANKTYADTVGSLNALQDVAGKKMDLFGPNADKAVGTLLRRMMSNAQSRVNLVDAVDSLDDVAKRYGGNFSDDIATQMLYADELDSVFGPVARTSLQGDVTAAVKEGAKVAAGQKTLTGAALEVGAAALDKAKGINKENAFKSIEELLKR